MRQLSSDSAAPRLWLCTYGRVTSEVLNALLQKEGDDAPFFRAGCSNAPFSGPVIVLMGERSIVFLIRRSVDHDYSAIFPLYNDLPM